MEEILKVIKVRADVHKKLKKIAVDREISLRSLIEEGIFLIEENWHKNLPIGILERMKKVQNEMPRI